jgi:thiamine-phosphate pyrophosphorylase
MLRYAITDRKLLGDIEEYRRNSLVHQAARWAAQGVEFIQLREKDLGAGEMVDLTRRVIEAVHLVAGSKTRVLVNSRADVAVVARADGVHLTAAPGGVTPEQVRAVFSAAGRGRPVVSVSCHTVEEVRRASAAGVDAILFGPVFAKVVQGVEVGQGLGIEGLRGACEVAGSARVFALGGVNQQNSAECAGAGAAGVAGIRLFMGSE